MITYRIANLVVTHRVPPYRILAVTFTNKAAQEMRHRLDALVGHDLSKDLWVGTFHATCARPRFTRPRSTCWNGSVLSNE